MSIPRHDHPRHDLDSRDERYARRSRDLHHLAKDAVDPVADDDASLRRLDVNVARPAVDAVGQEGIDQFDDRTGRRLFGADREIVDRFLADLGDFRLVRDAAEELLDQIILVVQFVELLADPARRAEQEPNLATRRERQHFLRVHVERVRRRHFEVRVGDFQRDHVEPAGQLLRDFFDHARIDRAQIGDRHPEPTRYRLQQRGFRRHAPIEHREPQ
jgi:hypothetical protein